MSSEKPLQDTTMHSDNSVKEISESPSSQNRQSPPAIRFKRPSLDAKFIEVWGLDDNGRDPGCA